MLTPEPRELLRKRSKVERMIEKLSAWYGGPHEYAKSDKDRTGNKIV
ncbi:MAG: hypothetical protein GTN81_06210 [Proteobacteria bacterium]|nr:hypothetical protein [Pseudomonadota bacterium]